MNKGRLEAFSDGVIAVIITIMVLEMKKPAGADIRALHAFVPALISYALSFVFVGIYWNNHHHLLQAAQKVNGPILWANLHWLFWLSLIPFFTGWISDGGFAAWPVALYGVVLFFSGISFYILSHALVSLHGDNSTLARALGGDLKGKVSIGIYALAIPLSFKNSYLAYGFYVIVALMWLVPDRRIERTLSK